MNKQQKFAIILALIASTLYPAINFFIPLHYRDIGLTSVDIGLITGIPIVISFLISIPIGFFNDKFQSKYFVSLGFLFLGIMHYGITLSSSFLIILFLNVFGSLGMSFYQISLDSLILKTKSGSKKMLSYYIGGNNVATGISKLLMGLLFLSFTLILCLKWVGFVYFIIAILALYLPKTGKFNIKFGEYKMDFLNKKVFIFMLIIFLFFLHVGAEIVSYSFFLENTFGFNKTQMGYYMGVPVIFLGISAYFFGDKLTKGYYSYKVLIIALLLNGFGHIIQTVPILYISFLARVVHEIGDGAFFIFAFNGLSILFPEKRVGGNISIFNLVKIMAIFISSVLTGIIAKYYGHSLPFIIAGIFCIMASGLAYYYKDLLTH